MIERNPVVFYIYGGLGIPNDEQKCREIMEATHKRLRELDEQGFFPEKPICHFDEEGNFHYDRDRAADLSEAVKEFLRDR